MSNKEMFDELTSTISNEYEKFESGNNAAGTRARKALSELSKLCKALRVEIQDQKNSDK
jgi:hypothetical protein|tara:strand:- start:13668 stop:13844 length:177 start_codon:yes stop_codon:yes gene_type:complete